MLKRKLTTSDFLLILVNLIPVYGVWFEGCNASQIFLVYCLETIIIGILNVLKMTFVTLFIKSKDEWRNNGFTTLQTGWLFIFFFIFHYGIFVFIQTQIFFDVSGLIKSNSVFGNYTAIPNALGNEGKLLLPIFVIYYSLQDFYNFFFAGEYKTISLNSLMFRPYGRIIIQQFVVIAGSMFLTFGAGKIFILILATVKIFFEVYFNFNNIIAYADKNGKA